ncbi:glycosyltransferase family 2 protein [Marinobacter flavimaris]|uniref:glycosyltransferase family 2 protein n=1 Tax=Marinobacter flavimaris TaxID=262076 RepID=UPI0038676892
MRGIDQLAVIVPVYNEDSVLDVFYERTSAILDGLADLDTRIVFVNDGSADQSLEILKRLAGEDDRVGYINLSRNFGKEAAMSAALDAVDADAVIIIDADLQDPPELIPDMVKLWREGGYDNIYGQRTERHGESLMKRVTAHYFYRFMGGLGRVTIPRDTGDFRLLSRRAVLALRKLPEHNRFMKGLFAWIGYRQKAMPYSRDSRFAGDTKFNYWKLWNFALDGITSFTTLPLKLATYLGAMVAVFAFIYGFFIVIRTLLYGDPVAGFPTLMTVILFLGGVQLLFLGILGEYLGRMFDETKGRPLYLIDEEYQVRSPKAQSMEILTAEKEGSHV